MRRRCLLPVPDHGATLGGAKGGLWELDEKKRALPPMLLCWAQPAGIGITDGSFQAGQGKKGSHNYGFPTHAHTRTRALPRVAF